MTLHDAFWIWYGKQAAKGEVEAGNQEQVDLLLIAFSAGWDALRVDIQKHREMG